MENSQLNRMKELIAILNEASKAYYAQDKEIMSNFRYDQLYDELMALEQETGIIMAGSPTVSVGYEAVDALPKERHEKPMLSLAKTKEAQELKSWLGDKEGLLSWKLDGLTIVLTYQGGKLQKAVTRGNGEVGEVITNNARVFVNLPATIPFQGTLILRGEAVITYSGFREINAKIPEEEAKYKNPRNLCSGSVRQLNNEITAKRKVSFYAFSFVTASGSDLTAEKGTPGQNDNHREPDFQNDRENQFRFLSDQGFDVVEYRRVNADNFLSEIKYFEEKIKTYDIPSDGLVLTYCDLNYASSLGVTAKFPRDSIAFKWKDEVAETVLREVEWSPSRTGMINPVAIFEPVELEGTTVSRASIHNISVMRGLKLGIGDRILVYKANMIIPQIAENLTKSGVKDIADSCPACGGQTEIHSANEVEVLYCNNPDCPAKKIKAFTLFVSRDAINIDGLSEATLEKFIGKGFIHDFSDIYHIEDHKETILQMEGFGEKSYANLLDSIENSRNTTLPRFLYALGIPGIGVANAKLIAKHFSYDLEAIRKADVEELSLIPGIGEVLAGSMMQYFANDKNCMQMEKLISEFTFENPSETLTEQSLLGKVFVITGSVEHFANRNELKELIEENGGKVTGSVTQKTNFLINNDITSNSGKNKKARELGVPVISEEDFLAMLH